ncbi:hypothetical protein C8R47DRAFT_1137246 [Mycena vitilis]|nr:hypothetical protein C8R47DRAFT_1137246 [Mycena vitilis]
MQFCIAVLISPMCISVKTWSSSCGPRWMLLQLPGQPSPVQNSRDAGRDSFRFIRGQTAHKLLRSRERRKGGHSTAELGSWTQCGI